MAINRPTPTVTQLRAFLALADHLHFRDAAAKLGISQPALSSAINALEETLATQLVERTTRRVLLTPAGRRVAHHAARVLGELDRLVESAAAGRPFAGRLELGVIPTVAPYVLAPVLRRVPEEYPDLELVIHEDQTDRLLAALHAGRLDLLLLALPTDAAGVVEIPLYDEDFTLVVPTGHRLAADEFRLPRRILKNLDVLLLGEGHCLRDQTLDVCREVGARAVTGTYATSLATLVQLVAAGLGVTLLPETAVPAEVRRGRRLAVRRFAPPAPYRRIGLAYRASSARGDEYAELAKLVQRALRPSRARIRWLR